MTAPGIGWVLGYTIAAEIGDISRFASPAKLAGYTGLCPRVYQSGGKDHRGPLAKNGPKYLRWALIEAAIHAAATRLRRPLPAHQDPAGPSARPQGRPGRPGPPAGRGDLAHADHQPTFRSGRCRAVSGLVEGPRLSCATGAKPLPSHMVPPLRRR